MNVKLGSDMDPEALKLFCVGSSRSLRVTGKPTACRDSNILGWGNRYKPPKSKSLVCTEGRPGK